MDIYQRIKQIRTKSQLSQEAFAARIGLTRGNYSQIELGKQQPTIKTLQEIARNYNISYDWLLDGKGEPEHQSDLVHVNEPVQDYSLRTDRRLHSQEVPLYDINASAGLLEVFDGTQVVIDTLHVPNLPKCDGSLIVTGHSMYPEIQSGDIVAYKFITDLPEAILFGESYLVSLKIDGEWTTVVKYVQKSEKGDKYVLLVSENKHHSPKDIKLENIRSMAHIKGVFRIKSMA